MAVAFDASSESHTGTTGATGEFSWTHTPSGTPKGVLVFTFTNGSSTEGVNGVAYQGYGLAPVSGGRAVDSAGEPGDCKAWLLSPGSFAPIAIAQSATSGTAEMLYEVAYANGYYAACGEAGVIIYKATDPTGSWSNATSGVATSIWGIAFGNGYWCGVGDSGVIRYKQSDTPDGSWSGATSGVASRLQTVSYGNGYWAACGDGGVIRYKASTPNGTWSGATSGTTNPLGAIAYGNGYWVIAGGSGKILYKASTPDGTWTAATSGTASDLYNVYYANGYWVATGNDGTIRYRASTPNGSWSGATSGTTSDFQGGLTYADGLWIACGGTPRYATDPTGTWSGMVSRWMGTGFVIYANGYVVQVGWNGQIDYGQRPIEPITVPTGAQTVTVRDATADEKYAVAITVTADYGVDAAGVVLVEGNGTLSEQSVDDGSSGSPSLRLAGINSGLDNVNLGTTTTAANTLVRGSNSTQVQSICIQGPNVFTAEKNYAISTTELATSASGTSIGSGDATSTTFATARTMKRSSLPANAYPADSQDWSVVYALTGVAGGQYESRMKLQRLNSSGTIQTESGYGTTRSASGTFTDTLSWTPGAWSANDQLALVWEHRRTASTELNYLVSTTGLSTTSSGTSIASGSTQSATFVVAQTMVRSGVAAGYFASGLQTWTLNYTVTAMTTPDYEMRLKIQRRNSAGTTQAETAYGTTRTTNAAFTDTFTADLGTWAANDQLAVVWEHRRISGTGNKSASITAGGTSYVTAPFPARNSSITANGSSYVESPTVPDYRVIGVVRETTVGQGSRPVGFQSTTSDDVAAVYLAIREAIVPWTVGVPIR